MQDRAPFTGNEFMKKEIESKNADLIRPWLAGLLGWFVPGLGHFYARRFGRGGTLGGLILLLFLSGTYWGGHLYSLFESSTGFLSYVFGLFDLGLGALYILSRVAGFAVSELTSQPMSEYGNIFLMCAGLLNYLIALDAHDIVAGRKE